MSVLIKNVKKELYARFKAKAAMKGLKLSEAFEEAMIKWINEDSPQTEEDKERALNNATLRRIRAELIKEHESIFYVIYNCWGRCREKKERRGEERKRGVFIGKKVE